MADSVHRRFQISLLVVTCLLLASSLIGAEYLQDQPLHHVPTMLAIIGLAWLAHRGRISNASMVAIVLFVWLHILGARYIYSFVPYDAWLQQCFGFSLDKTFGFTRNHYDRLVHFGYGLLATIPQVELLERVWKLNKWSAHFFSFVLVLAAGAVYEILEWGLAMVLAADWADRYNGQQGDIWDPQKDMLCAALGTLLSSAVMLVWHRVKRTRLSK